MEQTFFKFNHRFYRQTFGTPMGSPISPSLADFVMQDLETDIFKKMEFDIPVYSRYVDDTFLLIPKDKIHYILTMFNSYHKRLQFTYELENILTIFSVKKGTLPLRWVSSPGSFDCRSNALSSEQRRFRKTFLTESIYANLATDIS